MRCTLSLQNAAKHNKDQIGNRQEKKDSGKQNIVLCWCIFFSISIDLILIKYIMSHKRLIKKSRSMKYQKGEDDYLCYIFGQQDVNMIYRYMISGNRNFPCTSCDKKFKSNYDLTRHRQSVHLGQVKIASFKHDFLKQEAVVLQGLKVYLTGKIISHLNE